MINFSSLKKENKCMNSKMITLGATAIMGISALRIS